MIKVPRVKHLNPRQGITIPVTVNVTAVASALPCETPKSPPGDYNESKWCTSPGQLLLSVKHLNPRQGITIQSAQDRDRVCIGERVKHLNPRQGITMYQVQR